MSEPLRVCITGPESTGKTTLATMIARWAHAEWVPESSRLYAEMKRSPLDATDVEPIARGHILRDDAAFARARADGGRVVVYDTDLISTAVYAQHYYGAVPALVEREAAARRASLYLLCDVDVPWIPDGVRDRPEDREGMFALFAATLARFGATPVTIRGDWDERLAIGLGVVRELLERHGGEMHQGPAATGVATGP